MVLLSENAMHSYGIRLITEYAIEHEQKKSSITITL